MVSSSAKKCLISVLFFSFSDIDLVILGKWEHLPLFTLHDELVRSGIPRANNLMVLDKAAVSVFAILILNTLS